MKRTLCLVGILFLVGCSSVGEIFTDYPKQVALLEASLTTAEHTALIYVKLPVCGKTIASICRTPEITKKIGVYDEVAYTAVKAARTAEDQTSLEAARAAISALRSITDSLPGSQP